LSSILVSIREIISTKKEGCKAFFFVI